VFLSTGRAFEPLLDGALKIKSWTGMGYGAAPNGWYVGDFDGDGKDDIFRYCPDTQPCGDVRSGAEVFVSIGSGTSSDPFRFQSAGGWTGMGYGAAPNGWYVGDFDGDEKDDIFRYCPDTQPCDGEGSGAEMFLSVAGG
jgi:hypothetical protein